MYRQILRSDINTENCLAVSGNKQGLETDKVKVSTYGATMCVEGTLNLSLGTTT